MNIANSFALAVASAAVAGCADTPLADDDYGNSVKQMVQAQTFDPAAAANPPELAPQTTDGARLVKALEVYREDVAKGNTEVKRPIIFEVGTE